jgi:hypothetical protein
MEEGTPIGHLQSAVIDHAAALQKGARPGDIVVSENLAGAALIELGALAPVPRGTGEQRAFSWLAGREGQLPSGASGSAEEP